MIVAIDLGGTITKIALIENQKIIISERLESNSHKGLERQLQHIRGHIDLMLKTHKIPCSELTGVGMAFPGIVDPIRAQVISTNAKFDDACQLDLSQWVKECWQVPFVIDNDARLSTIGEWRYGAAKGCNHLVMMTLGTGVGTGVVVNGQVLYGAHCQGGSLGGHFTLDWQGESCSCGNRGCVERLGSSFFLSDIIEAIKGVSPEFKTQAKEMDFAHLFSLYRENEKNAQLVADQILQIWSVAIINYIHAYDPEVVVVGGGIMKSADIILPRFRQYINKYAWCPKHEVGILPSLLQDDAALFGLEYLLENITLKKNM